mmetsp:Transcript_30332/g.63908  ORF Transcript_30332/g.63908 Transcript_30332/m.63908 type:complete len:142 (+) Transcript_30332:921-1346(+)
MIGIHRRTLPGRHVDHDRGPEQIRSQKHVKYIVKENEHEKHRRHHDGIDVNQTQDEDAVAHSHDILDYPEIGAGEWIDAIEPDVYPCDAHSIGQDETNDVDPLEGEATKDGKVSKGDGFEEFADPWAFGGEDVAEGVKDDV